jgi:hypothetical protein
MILVIDLCVSRLKSKFLDRVYSNSIRMSKAYVRLNDNLSLDTTISSDSNKTKNGNRPYLRYIIYTLILGVIIGILIQWLRSESSENFDPDHPGSTDSFPARVDSNTTMNRAGGCNTPFNTAFNLRRSILKKKQIGYVRPFNQTEEERIRARRRLRVRWSDPLVRIMN